MPSHRSRETTLGQDANCTPERETNCVNWRLDRLNGTTGVGKASEVRVRMDCFFAVVLLGVLEDRYIEIPGFRLPEAYVSQMFSHTLGQTLVSGTRGALCSLQRRTV